MDTIDKHALYGDDSATTHGHPPEFTQQSDNAKTISPSLHNLHNDKAVPTFQICQDSNNLFPNDVPW